MVTDTGLTVPPEFMPGRRVQFRSALKQKMLAGHVVSVGEGISVIAVDGGPDDVIVVWSDLRPEKK
jgi:hypothetical protein